jgi:hypothetical protein
LDKDLCDRCGTENMKGGMGVSRLPQTSGYFFGDYSADFQLIGEERTLPSLVLWKRHLEKLKADVDQAPTRVCEGLLLFGPSSKSKRYGWKKKK